MGLGLALFRPPPAHAQTAHPFSLVTSPLPVVLNTKPGQPISTELRVKNASTATDRFKVSLFKFSVNDAGKVTLSSKADGDSFMDWVSFSPQTFSLAPNQWQSVKMDIKVPAQAALGYYYAVSFSRAEEDNTPATSTGVNVHGQVITFVLLNVDVPWAKRQLQVTELSADRSVYEFLPANFTVKVKNTGNIFTAPTGTLFVNRGSKTIATLTVNSGKGNILPGTTRTFSAKWSDGFPVYQPKLVDGQAVNKADGSPAMSLKWDFSKVTSLRIGKYTARLILVYDDGKRDVPIEGSVSFWVMPWRVLGVIAALIALIAGLITYVIILRRRLKRAGHPIRKAKE